MQATPMPSNQWSISEVREWLIKEGFEQHAARFEVEKIDGEALLALTADELKDHLGVAELGVRKRILNRIDRLKKPSEDDSWRESCIWMTPCTSFGEGQQNTHVCVENEDLSRSKVSLLFSARGNPISLFILRLVGTEPCTHGVHYGWIVWGCCFAVSFVAVTGMSCYFSYMRFRANAQTEGALLLELGWYAVDVQAVIHYIGACVLRRGIEMSSKLAGGICVTIGLTWVISCMGVSVLHVPVLWRGTWCVMNAFSSLLSLSTTLLLKHECDSLFEALKNYIGLQHTESHDAVLVKVCKAVKRWRLLLIMHVLLQVIAACLFLAGGFTSIQVARWKIDSSDALDNFASLTFVFTHLLIQIWPISQYNEAVILAQTRSANFEQWQRCQTKPLYFTVAGVAIQKRLFRVAFGSSAASVMAVAIRHGLFHSD